MNRWLAGQVFWPLTERMRGRDTMRRLHELEASQHWPACRLRALQTRKLRRLLKAAVGHCPFHRRRFRDAGLDVDDPKLSAEDLRRLPLLTRDDVREHLAEMTWMGCPGGARPYSTGGSSGQPLKFYFDRPRQAADWAARWRARSWWGVTPGAPEILLWGAPVELNAQDLLRTLRDRLLNQYLLSAFDMTVVRMDAYVAALQARRPACIYGYPSSLALLARHALENGTRLFSAKHPAERFGDMTTAPSPAALGSPDLRAVFVTGEVLAQSDRQVIERAFGVPVVVEYGCRDGGLLACQCRAGRLHVPEENVILEVLDAAGHPVAPGETGEVVVTNLDCLATPIIRYRTGDLATLSDSRCPCTLTSLTLLTITGRKTDQIVCRGPDGLKRMHALSLIYVLREADGLRQFRITQRCLDSIDVEIVPAPGFTAEVERAVLRGLRQRVGPEMSIHILRREKIEPAASGKHACVVSALDGQTRSMP